MKTRRSVPFPSLHQEVAAFWLFSAVLRSEQNKAPTPWPPGGPHRSSSSQFNFFGSAVRSVSCTNPNCPQGIFCTFADFFFPSAPPSRAIPHPEQEVGLAAPGRWVGAGGGSVRSFPCAPTAVVL